MDIESFRNYCLGFQEVTEHFPFDDKVLVFKVLGKMFALANIEEFSSFNVKCDPEKAIELRERYVQVLPGYHMSKGHWNTVMIDGEADDQLLEAWIKDSYDLIVASLPKKLKSTLLPQ